MNDVGILQSSKEALRRVLSGRVFRRYESDAAVSRRSKERLDIDIADGCLRVGGTLQFKGRHVQALEIKSRTTGEVMLVESESHSAQFEFEVALDDVLARFTPRADALDLSVSWVVTGGSATGGKTRDPESLRLGNFQVTNRPSSPVLEVVGGSPFRLDVSKFGNLSVLIGEEVPERTRLVTSSATVSGSRLDVSILATTVNREIAEASLVIRGRQTDERFELPLNVEWSSQRSLGECGRLTYELSGNVAIGEVLERMPHNEATIDFDVALKNDHDEPLVRRLPAPSEVVRNRSKPIAVDHNLVTNALVPYATFRVHNLSYRREVFATAEYRLMIRLAYLWPLFAVMRVFTRIWLVGEVPYKAQDNGFHLFKYIRETYPRRHAYYVISRDSPDYDSVAALGNVLVHGSRKHIWMSFFASRIAGTHHAEYLMPSRDPRVVRAIRGVRVFLQHGPTASKNVTRVYGRKTSQELPTERFLVTSELEKRIVIEDYGYRPHQVCVTGFARFDALLTDIPKADRTILVMPTWRDDLMSEEKFLQSSYLENWRGFLNSPVLHELLAQHDFEISLMLHPNMRKYASHFAVPHVRQYALGEINVQEMLRRGAALITDFSSVSWDFSYLDRPVYFFQFDQQTIQGTRTPHIDFVTSLPGPISTTPEQLVSQLAAGAKDSFVVPPEYSARSRAFLTHKDSRNRERVYGVVKSAWGVRTAVDRVLNWRVTQGVWRRYRASSLYRPSMAALTAFARVLPVSNDIIFESDRGRGYGDSPRYLYEALIASEGEHKIYWANNTTQRFLDPGTKKIRRMSPSYWWKIGRARLIVTNQNLPGAYRRHRRTFYLQTWHGTPLKKMQHDVPVMLGRDADYQQKSARLTARWSALISPSPFATGAFQSAFQFKGPILETGYPRNDVFSWDDRPHRENDARLRLGLTDETRKLVLYAPTFRDDARTGIHWSHRVALDIEEFASKFGDSHLLLLRLHPLVRAKLEASELAQTSVIDVSTYQDIQELLMLSDVLITDYSSLFFDYAQLGRPMLFFAYDLDHYRDDLRGFYLDYEQSVPGPIVRDQAELHAELENLAAGRDEFRSVREEFKVTYGPRDDGHAAERALTELRSRGALD